MNWTLPADWYANQWQSVAQQERVCNARQQSKLEIAPFKFQFHFSSQFVVCVCQTLISSNPNVVCVCLKDKNLLLSWPVFEWKAAAIRNVDFINSMFRDRKCSNVRHWYIVLGFRNHFEPCRKRKKVSFSLRQKIFYKVVRVQKRRSHTHTHTSFSVRMCLCV